MCCVAAKPGCKASRTWQTPLAAAEHRARAATHHPLRACRTRGALGTASGSAPALAGPQPLDPDRQPLTASPRPPAAAAGIPGAAQVQGKTWNWILFKSRGASWKAGRLGGAGAGRAGEGNSPLHPMPQPHSQRRRRGPGQSGRRTRPRRGCPAPVCPAPRASPPAGVWMWRVQRVALLIGTSRGLDGAAMQRHRTTGEAAVGGGGVRRALPDEPPSIHHACLHPLRIHRLDTCRLPVSAWAADKAMGLQR